MARTLTRACAAIAALLLLASSVPASASTPPAAVVYAVGDSIAAGTSGARGWGERLGDRLFGQDRTRYRVVAHPGQCLLTTGCGYPVPLVDSWAAEVLGATPTPTTVVVGVGTNDLQHRTGQQLLAAIAGLVNAAAARGIRVLVCTIPPRGADMWTSYWWWGPDRDFYNQGIKAWWPDNVVDLDAVLTAGAGTWAMDSRYNSGDNIHPNEWGYVRIADAVPLGRIQ